MRNTQPGILSTSSLRKMPGPGAKGCGTQVRTRRLNVQAIGALVFFLGLGFPASGQSGINTTVAGSGVSPQAQIPQPTDIEGWKSRGFGLLAGGHLQEGA